MHGWRDQWALAGQVGAGTANRGMSPNQCCWQSRGGWSCCTRTHRYQRAGVHHAGSAAGRPAPASRSRRHHSQRQLPGMLPGWWYCRRPGKHVGSCYRQAARLFGGCRSGSRASTGNSSACQAAAREESGGGFGSLQQHNGKRASARSSDCSRDLRCGDRDHARGLLPELVVEL